MERIIHSCFQNDKIDLMIFQASANPVSCFSATFQYSNTFRNMSTKQQALKPHTAKS